MGAQVAFDLTRLGLKDVVLLEKSALAAGPTGRSSAQLIPRSEHPVVARLKWEGLQFFRHFQAHTGRSADFRSLDYVAIAAHEKRAALEADAQQLRCLGGRAEVLSGQEARRVYSKIYATDQEVALHIEGLGYADPTASTRALTERAAERGARIFEFTPAKAIRVRQGGASGILTEAGEIACPTVVLACGVWSNDLLAPLDLALPLYWHRAEVCLFQRPAHLKDHPIIADFQTRCYYRPELGQLTLAGAIPVMRSAVEPPSWLETVKHPEDYREGVRPETIRALSHKLAFRLPAFSKAYWRRGYACVYDVTPDWHPVLSLSEKVKGLFIAAGFSGHGFVMSPAVGRIVAEAVQGVDKNQEERSLLRLERFEQNQPVVFEVG